MPFLGLVAFNVGQLLLCDDFQQFPLLAVAVGAFIL
jgi:hypothetical protein